MKKTILLCSVLLMMSSCQTVPMSERNQLAMFEDSYAAAIKSATTLFKAGQISESSMRIIVGISAQVNQYLGEWNQAMHRGQPRPDMEYRIDPLLDRILLFILEAEQNGT